MKLYRLSILSLLPVLSLAFSVTSCGETESLDKTQWVVTWQDEFNDPTADNRPDPAKWAYDIGANGWGNAEYQYYTNRVENASYTTEDGLGCLKITALSESYGGANFTSARLKTDGLFTQKYGRFEAKIKLPYGPGIWPAFWMLGDNNATDGWPTCGEIDIMEEKGYQPNIIAGSLHGPGYSGGNAITQNFGFENMRFDAGFHIYAVEWSEDKIDFFVDDVLYNRIKRSEVEAKGKWVYDHPFYIILNVAVGGNYVGSPTSATEFPQNMYVDYVRVYKKVI